jgi:hypothetical protein
LDSTASHNWLGVMFWSSFIWKGSKKRLTMQSAWHWIIAPV